MYRIIAIAGGCSVWNARSARAVVGARRHGGESAAGCRRTVGAGHAGIDFDFGYLTAGCHRPAPGRDEAAPAQGAETQDSWSSRSRRWPPAPAKCRWSNRCWSGDRDCTAARRRLASSQLTSRSTPPACGNDSSTVIELVNSPTVGDELTPKLRSVSTPTASRRLPWCSRGISRPVGPDRPTRHGTSLPACRCR